MSTLKEFREYWDLLDEIKNPWGRYIAAICIFGLACLLMWKAYNIIFSAPANSGTDTLKSVSKIEEKGKNDTSATVVKNKGIKNIGKPLQENKEYVISEKPPETPSIVNNGNLSVGQQGGIVNQNNYSISELPDRKVNEDDKEYFKSVMKDGYSIDFTIITSNSEEAEVYGLQLLDYLQRNYNVSNSTLIGISSSNRRRGNKRFYVDFIEDKKLVSILVQSQE